MKLRVIMVALAFVIAAMVIFALRSEPERVAAAEVASKSLVKQRDTPQAR